MKTLVWYWLIASTNYRISYQESIGDIGYNKGFFPQHTVIMEWTE